MRAVTIRSRKYRTAAISHRLDLNQPQKTGGYEGDDCLCLYGSNAEDRGRVRSAVLICYGSHGLFPSQTSAYGEWLINCRKGIWGETSRSFIYLLGGVARTGEDSAAKFRFQRLLLPREVIYQNILNPIPLARLEYL